MSHVGQSLLRNSQFIIEMTGSSEMATTLWGHLHLWSLKTSTGIIGELTED